MGVIRRFFDALLAPFAALVEALHDEPPHISTRSNAEIDRMRDERAQTTKRRT